MAGAKLKEVMNELANKVKELLEILEQTAPSLINENGVHHPIYIGCSLPYPSRENLNKVLDEIKLLTGSSESFKGWRGNLN